MLQPLQLKDVSAHYAGTIAEMRDFLSKAGILTGRAAALSEVASRLQRDRAFRRDLTSHVWVVIEESDRSISYPDLLGVLAIAASGIHFAADADDYGAHDLLRFLMESRRSLEEGPETGNTPAPPPPPEPVKLAKESPVSPEDMRRVLLEGPLRPRKAAEFAPEPPKAKRQSPVVWIIAAACLLAALLAGFGVRSRSVPTAASTPLSAEESGVSTSAELSRLPALPRLPVVSSYPESPAPIQPDLKSAVPSRRPSPVTPRNSRVGASYWTAPISREAPTTAPATATDRSTREAPVTRTAANDSPAAPSSETSFWVPRASSSGTNAAIPSAVLSRRLGSRSLPIDSGEDSTSSNSRYPQLLRRRAPSTALSEDQTSLMAEDRPSDAALPGGRPGTSGAPQRGVVQPGSLGIMAGNVLYSPAPAYPAAASMAHVQGEVKVEAQIDRDGNVAAARVISGPPLLRDAAMDAVQRWRFRPFLTGGKPTSMSAIAIVDFRLQ